MKKLIALAAVVAVVLGLTCGVSTGGLIFSVDHNNLPAVGASVATWDGFTKSNGDPTVVELGGEKSHVTSRAEIFPSIRTATIMLKPKKSAILVP